MTSTSSEAATMAAPSQDGPAPEESGPAASASSAFAAPESGSGSTSLRPAGVAPSRMPRRVTGAARVSPPADAPGVDWLLAMQNLVAEVSAVEAGVGGGAPALPVGRHEAAATSAIPTPMLPRVPAHRAGRTERGVRPAAQRERARPAARWASVPLAAAASSDYAMSSAEPTGRRLPQGQDLALALLALAVLIAVALVLTGSPS